MLTSYLLFDSIQIIMYETTEPYDGSSKDGYLTLDKGCQVEVLDKSGSDWLVCTVAETCSGVEKEGIIPKHILTPVTRHSEDSCKSYIPSGSLPEAAFISTMPGIGYANAFKL